MKRYTEKKWFQGLSESEGRHLSLRVIELEEECNLMQRYLASQGKETAESILEELSSLAVIVEEIRKTLVKKGELNVQTIKDHYLQVLKVHNKLSAKVAPANAVSIKYTEYSRGFFLRRNPVVNFLILFTTFILGAYILVKSLNTLDVNLQETLLIIIASGLGAGFYTLTTVRTFLINRTYNPRYNPTYLIRFFLGISAGSILAFIFHDSFKGYPIEVLAIVGGFSADAVAIILKRISEILIATIKGSPSEDEKAGEIIKKEKDLIKKQSKNKGMEELHNIKSIAIQNSVPSDVLKAIENSIEKIQKS